MNLIYKWAHVIFIDWVEGTFTNLVWKKTLSKKNNDTLNTKFTKADVTYFKWLSFYFFEVSNIGSHLKHIILAGVIYVW
jgi:hypothetical protein